MSGRVRYVLAAAVILTAGLLGGTGPSLAQVTDSPSGLPETFTYGLDVVGMYDTNILRNPPDEAFSAPGASVDLVIDYENGGVKPSFFFRTEAGVNRFANTDERDYWRFRLRTAYRTYLSETWDAEVAGRASIGVITAEYLFADQYNVIGRLQYDPGYHHRARLYASYRYRLYRDASGTGAHSPYVIGSYRRRFGSWHYWDTDVWYENNMADVDSRTFVRYRLATAYTRPLNDRHRLRVGGEYQYQPYRDYPVGGGDVDRLDRRLIGQLVWIMDVNDYMRLYTDYEYRTRFSNAVDREYASHRISLRAQLRW